jgi:hypothetical protein
MIKTCSICSDDFEGEGRTKTCEGCRALAKKKYMEEYMHNRHQRLKTDPEYKAYRAQLEKEKRERQPEFFKAREFRREMKKYGTTVEWYRDKLIEQCGVCALCKHLSHHHGTIQRLQVDHNHDCCDLKTKSCGHCLRGLLCADCNILLSYLERFTKDTTTLVPRWDTWLEDALLYLTRYGCR